jgi:hypothetical protein
VLQASHGEEAWFSKRDIENAAPSVGDKDLDCNLLVERCIQAKERDDRFQFEVLLYEQYTTLDGSVDYNHRRDDLMCVIWMEPRQQALAMAKTYTFSWDASHKTNWLGLKYFDFCTIGDMGMLELLAQGLQRHEDNATSLWILDRYLVFMSVAVRPLFGFIDGAPECIFSCTEMESNGRILGWAFDEWHNNQNYNKNFFPLLGRDAHGFISKIHSLQYDDDIRTQLQIYKALETACSELGYGVDVTWESGARQPLFRVTNEEGDAHAPGVLFMNKLCNNVHRWARCALQHACCCTCHMPAPATAQLLHPQQRASGPCAERLARFRCFIDHVAYCGLVNGTVICESHHAAIKRMVNGFTRAADFLSIVEGYNDGRMAERNSRNLRFHHDCQRPTTGA